MSLKTSSTNSMLISNNTLNKRSSYSSVSNSLLNSDTTIVSKTQSDKYKDTGKEDTYSNNHYKKRDTGDYIILGFLASMLLAMIYAFIVGNWLLGTAILLFLAWIFSHD